MVNSFLSPVENLIFHQWQFTYYKYLTKSHYAFSLDPIIEIGLQSTSFAVVITYVDSRLKEWAIDINQITDLMTEFKYE